MSYEASCNSADDKGSSPLHLAAWAGNKEIVDMLLTKGPSIANVNLTVSLTTQMPCILIIICSTKVLVVKCNGVQRYWILQRHWFKSERVVFHDTLCCSVIIGMRPL